MTFDYYDPTDPSDRRRVLVMAPLLRAVLVPLLAWLVSGGRWGFALAVGGLVWFVGRALVACLLGRGTPNITG